MEKVKAGRPPEPDRDSRKRYVLKGEVSDELETLRDAYSRKIGIVLTTSQFVSRLLKHYKETAE